MSETSKGRGFMVANVGFTNELKKRIISKLTIRFFDQMTLKQLEAFYWAATCASFAAAAERVHLTVSSLSKRLAELEASIGQNLFDRRGHRAVLTPAGERFLPQAVALLQHAAEVRQLASTGQSNLAGQCRLGSGELASITWLPQWVQSLRASHPDLSISVVVDIGEVLADRLEKGELDVAVIAGAARRTKLRSIPLASASFVLCAAPEQARRIKTLNADSISQQTLVCLPRGSGVTHILDEWLDRVGARPRERLVCNQWGAAAGLVAAGAGIGLLPMGLAKALVKRQQLRTIRCPQPLRSLEYELHFRDEDPRPLLAELIRTGRDSVNFDAPGPFS